MKKGILVVASGFSGAGKGTIMKKLMSEKGENYALSISATTRAPREGEEHGREYFFLTVEEFEAMIARDELVEYAKYVNNYYGTPKTYVEEQLNAGKNVILEIEIQGALKIKEKFPETVLMFITAPSAEELKSRLIGRGTETQEVIDARMSRAYEESLGVENYDYLDNYNVDQVSIGFACGANTIFYVIGDFLGIMLGVNAVFDFTPRITVTEEYKETTVHVAPKDWTRQSIYGKVGIVCRF